MLRSRERPLTRLLRPIVAPGLPSEVVLRRVAEVEARLASQEFSVLQARAVFFPSITLNGAISSATLSDRLARQSSPADF